MRRTKLKRIKARERIKAGARVWRILLVRARSWYEDTDRKLRQRDVARELVCHVRPERRKGTYIPESDRTASTSIFLGERRRAERGRATGFLHIEQRNCTRVFFPPLDRGATGFFSFVFCSVGRKPPRLPLSFSSPSAKKKISEKRATDKSLSRQHQETEECGLRAVASCSPRRARIEQRTAAPHPCTDCRALKFNCIRVLACAAEHTTDNGR